MTLFTKINATIIGLLLSSSVLAHTGHDHSHWTSGIFHALWVIPLIAVLAFAATRLSEKVRQKK